MGAAVLLLFGTAAPAFADDPPTPTRAAPAPRGGRALPTDASFETVVTFANDSARDLDALQEQARAVTAARNETLAQISTLTAPTGKPGAIRGRLERETLRAELRAQETELQVEAVALAPYVAIAPAHGAWMTPAEGPITQDFGPTRYWYEPARTYGGVFYRHFHEGIDIGAEMYAPVVAAAPGRVVWVGHVPDGAMIVLIAHVGGLVSLYAHLDDEIAPPRVAAGDDVIQGQVIGAIGITGMTTGPHLHFVVWRDGELIDPMSVIAP